MGQEDEDLNTLVIKIKRQREKTKALRNRKPFDVVESLSEILAQEIDKAIIADLMRYQVNGANKSSSNKTKAKRKRKKK
jgi:hypothetical protein